MILKIEPNGNYRIENYNKKTKNSLDALNSGNYRTDQQNLPNLNDRKKEKKKKYH